MPVETNIKFPNPSMENWRQAAEKALKGADFDETLRSQTADGLTINPLYAVSYTHLTLPTKA